MDLRFVLGSIAGLDMLGERFRWSSNCGTVTAVYIGGWDRCRLREELRKLVYEDSRNDSVMGLEDLDRCLLIGFIGLYNHTQMP